MPTSNVRQLLENGVPIYPITDKSLVIGLQDVPFESYVVAWDGASTPVPANIPAGVVVTYNTTDYTGTLAAGSATAPYLYLVASASQQGEYDRYIVTHTGSTYAWTQLGSTAPVSPVIADNLTTNDASKALSAKQGKILGEEVGELEAKVYKVVATTYPNINKRLDASGALGGVGGYETSDFYSLAGVASIDIKASITANSLAIAYYSAASESAFISGINANLETTIQASAFPTGATHIRVSSVRANDHHCNLIYTKTWAEEANDNVLALTAVVNENGDVLHQVYGGTVALTPTVQRDGYCLDGTGAVVSGGNYVVSVPIRLLKGMKVTFESYAASGYTILALTDAAGSSYTPVAKNTGSSGAVISGTYVMQQDGYVAWSYLTTQTHNLSVSAITNLLKIDNDITQLGGRESNTEELLGQVFGVNESLTPATQRDGYSIGSDGTVNSSANYKITEPVKMLKGQKVTVESYAPNNGCQLATTDATGTSYTPVILNKTGAGNVITNTYIASVDCYVAVSYLSTKTFTMSITSAIDIYTTKTLLDALTNPDTTAIEYLNPDVEFVPKFIQAKKKTNNVAPLVLAMFTDIHGGAEVNLPRIISFCGRHATRIDDIYNLGDMVADQFSNDFVWPDVDGAENILNVIGNHDTATYTSGIGYDWLAHIGTDAYDKYIKPFVDNWNVTQPEDAETNGFCYYYKDYATQGIRVIFLDVMAYGSTEEAWLTSILADAKTNSLSVLIVGHNPSATVTGFNCNYGSLKQNSATLATYQPNITGATSVIDSFISSGGKFIAWVCGHYHRDIIGKLNNTNQLCFLLDNANYGQFAASDMYDKVAGNRTQDSITFITIDTEAKTISAFKVGCRVDRWLRDRSSICIDYTTQTILCES